jgi:pyruvate/2-oxoglutarate dehydrogenase complex dihydrolipoamide dehydrogenase (E3) component
MGEARFTGPRTVEVALNEGGTRVLVGKEVVINVGSNAAMPAIPGIEAVLPLTDVEELVLDIVPPHLVVLGGGYTGIEVAQAFRRFGSAVTVIEPGPRILGREDAVFVEAIAGLRRRERIEIAASAHSVRVEGRSGNAVRVFVRDATGERAIECTHLLVAAGRIANTAGIGFDKAGEPVDAHGFIQMDAQLRTAALGVWAIGECAGSPQFTHVSVDDFRIVQDVMAGGTRSTADRLIPHVVYTDPRVARVGLSENETRRQGIPVRVAKLPMRAVLRTEATEETDGFMSAAPDSW